MSSCIACDIGDGTYNADYSPAGYTCKKNRGIKKKTICFGCKESVRWWHRKERRLIGVHYIMHHRCALFVDNIRRHRPNSPVIRE